MSRVTVEAAQRVLREAECLHSAAAVEAALDRMAAAITRDFRDRNPLVLTVLTGGIVVTGHLLTRLDFPLQLDYLHATRYQGGTHGGELAWIAHPRFPLAGRHLLIVDDILDEGLTLQAVVAHCRASGAASVATAVLVRKRHDRRPPGVEADYVGLEVEDRYVFGFGMDYHDYHRNLPAIYAVRER